MSLFEIGLLAACIAIVAVGLPQNLLDVVVLTFLYAGLALAWNIAGGYAGLISFGHAAVERGVVCLLLRRKACQLFLCSPNREPASHAPD